MRFRDGSDKGTAVEFVKISEKCNGDHEPYPGTSMACSVQGRPKKARQVRSKVKSMLIIFFDIKGIIHKEFVLSHQTVNSAYCCDVLRRLLESVRRLRPELWRQENWLLLHNNASSNFHFHQGIFDQKQQNDCRHYSLNSPQNKQNKLHGLSPRVNYTDRATAASRRS
jgi:hypothetical protein